MPIFDYKAKRGPEETVSGTIDAVSEEQAVAKLEAMGLVPISIAAAGAIKESPAAPVAAPAGAKGRTAPKQIRVGAKDVDIFTRQLASLIKAGIPILRAFSLIAKQTEGKPLNSVVRDLEAQVREGRMLSEAMANYPGVFNNLYLTMIRTGEKSGAIEESLFRLNAYRQNEREMQRKIQAALAYPLFVVVVGAGTIFAMLVYFLPKLTLVFKNMRQELPLPTRLLMGTSSFITRNWLLLAVFFGLIAFVALRKRPGSKTNLLQDIIKLRLPLIKTLVKNSEIAKFSRTLGLLLKSGIPVYQSLELAASIIDNEFIRTRLLNSVKDIISQGATLSDSLRKTGIFPDFAINMIIVGEEGGKLDNALLEIANTYETEVDQQMKIISSLLEPALILIVGGIVGFMVFAMLLPIFSMGTMTR